MRLSFKNRIAAYNLIAIALLIFVVFVMIYVVVYFTSFQHIDNDILKERNEVFKNVECLGDSIIVYKIPDGEEFEYKRLEANPTFIQIVDRNGISIFKSVNMKDDYFLFNPKNEKIVYYNTALDGQRIRLGEFPILNERKQVKGYLTIGISRQES
ncbi:MAG: hypothetical protein K1X55_08660, partial [Chitinophagales bacterium]|nr:hypothetical protein [Chitinophagales bacterium]